MVTKTASLTAATDRGEATRRHILDVAAAAFAEHGYRGISLNDIVRDSGLTKGAFYFHFPSKEALALAVFQDRQEQWFGTTMQAVATRSRAIDQLEAMLDAGCEMAESDTSARVVGRLCYELSSEKRLLPLMAEHLDRWFGATEHVIRRAQGEGDVRPDLDARQMAETIVAAFIGIEQISDELSDLKDFRRRIEGLRTLTLAALRTRA